MVTLVTGGCLCGRVRYQANPRPDTAYYCHCRDCQIGSSSAFSVAIFSEADDFHLTSGELSTFSQTADSGRRIHRKFCSGCGTAVAWTGEGFPDVVLVSLSSLDDPEAYQPVREIWTKSRVSWCRISDSVQSFPGRPANDG